MEHDTLFDALWVDGSDNSRVLRVYGELDAFNADRLVAALRAGGTSKVVVDLTGLSFMDAGGLSAVVRAKRLCESAGGSMTITGAYGIVRRVFQVTGLESVLED